MNKPTVAVESKSNILVVLQGMLGHIGCGSIFTTSARPLVINEELILIKAP
jgi:hypothetical protein